MLKECYSNDGKLLACGNGGSAADAEHIVGELMKGFKKQRRISPNKSRALIDVHAEMGKILAENLQGALSAIALDGHIALSTAYMNDCEPLYVLHNRLTDMDAMVMYFLEFLHQEIARMFCMQQ